MPGMDTRPDDEAAGLLDGLEGEAREQRIALLEELREAGAEEREIADAVADGRLALLPAERALTGEQRYSQIEIAEQSGVPVEVLAAQRRALGLAAGEPDAREHGDDDLEAAKRVRVFLDAGIEAEEIAEMARVMAMSMSQFAAANREVVGQMFGVEPGSVASELEIARRVEGLTLALTPLIGPTLEYAYKLQLREQLRHAAIDFSGTAGETDEAGEEMAVAFADLVGFTRLGERLPPEQLGRLTGRLGQLAAEVATGPVRLIKLIGDAAMLGSANPEALVAATLELVEAVDREGEDFPELRAGIALGPLVSRGGDLYGRTVNLASRVTGVARPGTVLVSSEVSEALEGRFQFSDAGHKRLKGIEHPAHLFRCRALEPAGEGGPQPDESEATEQDADEPEADSDDGRHRRRRRRR